MAHVQYFDVVPVAATERAHGELLCRGTKGAWQWGGMAARCWSRVRSGSRPEETSQMNQKLGETAGETAGRRALWAFVEHTGGCSQVRRRQAAIGASPSQLLSAIFIFTRTNTDGELR